MIAIVAMPLAAVKGILAKEKFVLLTCKPSHRKRKEADDMMASVERKWLALALLSVVHFMVVLDIAIVNVALPSIQVDLGFSQENLQWVISAYALVFGGFLLLGGPAAALPRGPRDVLRGGVVFSAAPGVLLGGILTDALSWEWIFFVNVPVGAAAFALTPVLLAESRDASVRK